jgi:hypothetical protein
MAVMMMIAKCPLKHFGMAILKDVFGISLFSVL